MTKPVFTRKELAAASTKRSIDWPRLKNMPLRFNMALEEVLKGNASEQSKVDLATLYSFFISAKELGLIDDSGLIENSAGNLARAYTREVEGNAFRLDATSAEALREMIASYEDIAKSVSARDYMRIINHVPKFVKC
jgi:hypothetical protein